MIQRVCAVLFLLTVSCASTKSTESATSGDVYCAWRSSEWKSWAPVSLPGESEPLGDIYEAPWHALLVNADLHKTPSGHAVLEGTLESDVVKVSVSVDANEQQLLYLSAPRSVGTWLTLTPDAQVRISRARPGMLEISPALTDLRGITPVTPISIPTGCEDVTFRTPRFSASELGAPETFPEEIEALGLKTSLPMAMSMSAARPLRETIDGPPVATVALKELVSFHIMEDRPNDVRIGIRAGRHAFVIGWISKADLTMYPRTESRNDSGAGPGNSRSDMVDRRSCSESLGLGIRREGAVKLWGMLSAGAPFEVLTQPEMGWVRVKVKNFRFHPWKNTELVLPERAAQCPHAERVQREPGE